MPSSVNRQLNYLLLCPKLLDHHSFLAARVFTEGVRRAGKLLTRESLRTGLESMHEVNLGGFIVNYSPKNHEASRYSELTSIGRGGRFVR
jgi:branched-chain amino acid transport system substrate-binding protein